jgi:dihydroflavonol-4-reductase
VQKTNIEGTRNVMEAAKTCEIKRVIHISSIHAYQQKPIHDSLDEFREKTNEQAFAYDRSKKESETLALSFASASMDVLVMNPTSIIGPHDYKPSKMGRAIIELCTGKLPFILSGGFDFCDGRDVSVAVVNALSMGRNGESYLLSGKWHSIRDVPSMLSAASGQKINVINLPLFLGWVGLPFITLYGRLRKEEPLYTNEALVAIADGNRCISSAKACTELKYHARSLEETLRDTYNWFLENRYLG